MSAVPCFHREGPILFDSRPQDLSRNCWPPPDFTRRRSPLKICAGPGRETPKKFSNTRAQYQLHSGRCWNECGWKSGRRSALRRRRRSSAIGWGMRSGSAPMGFWRAGRPRPATAAPLGTGETPGARRSIGDREIVKIKVVWIGKTKEPAIQALTDEYLKRIRRYAEVAGLALKDEAAILSLATGERQQKQKKERHKLVLVD